MSVVKRKYVNIIWNEISIEKIELVEKGLHNFIIDSFDGDILNLMNSLNVNFKFKFNGGNFSLYINGDIDPINIKHYDKISFGSNPTFCISSMKNNLNIAKEILKLFEIKYKQKKIRKKIKSQLKNLGYKPDKVKQCDQHAVEVITRIGKITIITKDNQATLKHVINNGNLYMTLHQIDDNIKKLEENIKSLNDLKETYLELSFDIHNFVI